MPFNEHSAEGHGIKRVQNMKKIIRITLFSIALFLTFPMCYAKESEMLKTTRKELLSFMRQEGYLPNLDDDGDIHFKYNGDSYYLMIEEHEKYGFYIALRGMYNGYEGLTQEQKQTLQKVINSENQRKRCLKIFILDDLIVFTVETWITKVDNIQPFFNLYLEGLNNASRSVSSSLSTSN